MSTYFFVSLSQYYLLPCYRAHCEGIREIRNIYLVYGQFSKVVLFLIVSVLWCVGLLINLYNEVVGFFGVEIRQRNKIALFFGSVSVITKIFPPID